MKRILPTLIASVSLVTCSFGATLVNIDLSGASTGTLITAPGGSFAESFLPQSVVGTGLVGAPSNPLTLQPAGVLDVAMFTALGFTENTILPEPGNQGPLALKLDQEASAISWIMGFADSTGPITVNFYDAQGALVDSATPNLITGYNSYSFTPSGAFLGVSISDDNDPAGLRFMHFQYETAEVIPPMPEIASTALLLGLGLLGLTGMRRLTAKD